MKMASGGRNLPGQRAGLILLILAVAGAVIWLAGKGPAGLRGTAYAAEQASPAQGEKDSGQIAPSTKDGQTAKESRPAAASEPASSSPDSGLRDMHLTLQSRERDLDEREKLLKKDAEQLAFLRAGLEAKIEAMKTLQADLRQLLERTEALRKKEVKNLIEILTGMGADKVRGVIEELVKKDDEEMALTILNGLDKTMVSKILGKMESDKASELSQKLIKMPNR